MLDDEIRSKIDQSTALMAEMWPPMWRNIYLSLVKEGFTEVESLDLLKVFILSQGTHGPQLGG